MFGEPLGSSEEVKHNLDISHTVGEKDFLLWKDLYNMISEAELCKRIPTSYKHLLRSTRPVRIQTQLLTLS
jgi:hypothetical protein